MLFLWSDKTILEILISRKLKPIGRYLPQSSWHESLIYSLNAFTAKNMPKTLSGALELMLAVHLHPALNQLDRSDDEANHHSSKRSILKAVHVAELCLVPEGLIRLVRTENKGVDDGVSDERVVYATEQLQKSLSFDDACDGAHHAQIGISLHVHLDRVEGVTRYDTGNSGKNPTAEVLQVFLHYLY